MRAKDFEEYARESSAALTKAWDMLEEMSVRGYKERERITVAQSMILNVYNLLKKLEKDVEAEKEKMAAGSADPEPAEPME